MQKQITIATLTAACLFTIIACHEEGQPKATAGNSTTTTASNTTPTDATSTTVATTTNTTTPTSTALNTVMTAENTVTQTTPNTIPTQQLADATQNGNPINSDSTETPPPQAAGTTPDGAFPGEGGANKAEANETWTRPAALEGDAPPRSSGKAEKLKERSSTDNTGNAQTPAGTGTTTPQTGATTPQTGATTPQTGTDTPLAPATDPAAQLPATSTPAP